MAEGGRFEEFVSSQISCSYKEQDEPDIRPLYAEVTFKIHLRNQDDDIFTTLNLDKYESSILQFLISEKETLNKKLKEALGSGSRINISGCHLELEVNASVNLADVMCASVKTLEELTKQVMSQDIVIPGKVDQYKSVFCSDVLPYFNTKRADLYHSNNDKIIIVGYRPEVDTLYREVKEKISQLGKDQNVKEENKEVCSMEIPLKICNPKCFYRLKFDDVIRILYPVVFFEVVEESNCITFHGEKEDVLQCIADFQKHEKRIRFSEVKMPSNDIKSLQTSETEKYMYEVLHRKQIVCYYELDTDQLVIKVFAMSQSVAGNALKCIMECCTVKNSQSQDKEHGLAENSEKASQSKKGSQHQATKFPPKHSAPQMELEKKVEIRLSDNEYKMMQFFCQDCLDHFQYNKGVVSRLLKPRETEQGFIDMVQSKLYWFNQLTTIEIPSPLHISYDKLKEVEKAISDISNDIFCCCSDDKKTLILKGSNYEKLQTAKPRSEVILGIQQQGAFRGGRRNRVINIDESNVKDKKALSRSYDQDMNTSRSSFSQSFKGNSRSTVPITFLTPEGLVVKVYVGNILKLDVDCIVNAANEQLSHGGGVADVISRAAGHGFQQESYDYIKQYGALNVTECCTTSAGNLKYKFVIHAVGPRWYAYPVDKRACADDLKETIVNCFKEVEVNCATSVALPAISSGIYGVPKDVCCMQYRKAVIEYSNKCGNTTCLKEIHFIGKDTDMVNRIQIEFGQHLRRTPFTSS